MRRDTGSDNNQHQHREHRDIQQCVNHYCRFGDMIYRRPEKFPALIEEVGRVIRPMCSELKLACCNGDTKIAVQRLLVFICFMPSKKLTR